MLEIPHGGGSGLGRGEATVTTTEQSERAYTLGHADDEIRRLEEQGDYLRDFTRDVFVRAGLQPGMRVLDYGCGAGDVSLLAAELVGPAGEVVGFDRSATAVEKARARAAARGLDRVRFFEGDETTVGAQAGDRPFDAAVGRLVLIHQRDLPGALRSLTAHVRPGGMVAFHEIDIEGGCWTEPRLPLYERTFSLICQIVERGGLPKDLGRRLVAAFDEVGIQPRHVRREGIIEHGSRSQAQAWVTGFLRTIFPLAEKLGVATGDVDLDTLVERLQAEAEGAHWIPVHFVAAWGRVPEVR